MSGTSKTGLRGPWPGPAGMIPEPEQNPADANIINRQYLDSILIEEHLIGAAEADLTFELFGRTYSSPIMMPAFSHLNKASKPDRKPMQEYAQAAKDLGLVNWVGMEPDDEYRSIAAVGADTVRIIKPFADHDEILKQIETARECGAVAVGIDIDHVFGENGSYDVVDGHPMGPVTSKDLESYIDAAGDLPFIAKGVLSAADAEICAEAGCYGIFVSHHHGRMPFAVPPLLVLPDITDALGENSRLKIFVDCGIDDGRDAFKALALGADAVSVGRGILPGLLSEGTAGVEKKIQKMNQELKQLMGYTGIRNLSEMTSEVLWFR